MMDSKKIMAVVTMAVLLSVSLMPIIGYDGDAAYFIDDVEFSTDGTPITSVDDLRGMNPASNYYQTNDIVFGENDRLDGVSVTLSVVSISGRDITISVSSDGSMDATIWFNGESRTGTTATFNTYESGRPYTIVAAGTINGEGFATSMILETNESRSVTKNSKGNFTPIENFTGTYNGNGFTITGMETIVYDDTNVGSGSGMFTIGEGGIVTNLGLVGGTSLAASVNGIASAGGIAASANSSASGVISNCFNTGDVIAAGDPASAGGIIGRGDNITIRNCYNGGTVSSTGVSLSRAGGITGDADTSGPISYCYNTGRVEAFSTSDNGSAESGGVIGYTLANSYANHNTGTVYSKSDEGDAYAGGVVGRSPGNVASCYSLGSVESISGSGSSYAGGLIGSSSASVYNCFNRGAVKSTVTGNSGTVAYSGGIAGEAKMIHNSYSTGAVSAVSGDAGGIVGYMEKDANNSITNCYFQENRGSAILCGSGETGLVIDGDTDDGRQFRSGPYSTGDMRGQQIYFNGNTTVDGSSLRGWLAVPANSEEWVRWSSNVDTVNNGLPSLDGLDPASFLEILVQPANIVSDIGSSATLTVEAYSDLEMTYQWKRSTNPGTENSWSNISGATDSNYTIDSVSSGDLSYSYLCVITTRFDGNTMGTATTNFAEIKVYNKEVRTVEDLINISKYPDGTYKQMNDIIIESDRDYNGGVGITVTITESSNVLTAAITYGEDIPATGLSGWINGEMGIARGPGVIDFNNYRMGDSLLIGGDLGTDVPSGEVAIELPVALGIFTFRSNGNFNPIGTADNPFTGSYDGNGYSVKGLEISMYREGAEIVAGGLFGVIDGGTVKSLGVADSSILVMSVSDGNVDVNAYGGAVAGYIRSDGRTVISDCYSTSKVTSFAYSGGNADVMSSSGGIIGYLASGEFILEKCYNTNTVSSVASVDEQGNGSSSSDAGGIIGRADDSAALSVINSYNMGNISASADSSACGGIAGYANASKITNCYSIGTFSGVNAGGIAGVLGSGSSFITNCYFLGVAGDQLCSNENVAIIDGNDGRPDQGSGFRSESDLKNRNTYYTGTTTVDGQAVAGWDISSGNIWRMDGNNSGYPYLKAVVPDDNGGGGLEPWMIAVIIIAIAAVVIAAFLLYRRSKA